jgi:hypothetical protein
MHAPTPRQLKAIVFVDADVTIRHFLLNDTFDALMAKHDCIFVLPPEGWNRIVNGRALIPERFRTKIVELPEARRRIWKRLVAIDQMRFPLRRDKYRLWKLRFHHWGFKAAFVHAILALPGIRHVVEYATYKRMEKVPAEALEALIDAFEPDVLIHPSTFEGYFINDVVEIGHRRKIPSILVMNSWDNPSIKRAAAGTPDWVVVWGEQTRIHCVEMMRAPAERVRIIGAAQFDVFRNPPRIDPAAFRAEYGFDPSARVVLYAGSSKHLDEAQHLNAIDAEIAAGALPPMKIVYRPHPFGMRQQFAKNILAANWRHVHIESTMRDFLARIADGTHRGFHITDYARTHDILSSVDAIVSPLSTILIESAVHGKPALCYRPKEKDDEVKGVFTAQLRHFEELFDMNLLLVARTVDSFVPLLRELMAQADDPGYPARIKERVAFFVATPQARFKDALEAFVGEVAAQHEAAQ